MFSATSLLVLACACAVAVDAQSACSPLAQIGTVSDHPVNLPNAVIPPYNVDYLVHIPNVPECVNGESGVQAYACDADVAPSLNFQDFYNLKVHRNGAANQNGYVAVTVFCN